MNAKKVLLAAVLWSGCFVKVGYAEIFPPSLTYSAYWPQFYAGFTGGIQRMSGPRSEVVNYEALGVPPEILTFSSLKSISNKNAFGSGHVGCTWNIPRTAFFIGPELYIGQGNVKNTLINFRQDPNTGLNRSLNATIRQSTLFGGALQVGVKSILVDPEEYD